MDLQSGEWLGSGQPSQQCKQYFKYLSVRLDNRIALLYNKVSLFEYTDLAPASLHSRDVVVMGVQQKKHSEASWRIAVNGATARPGSENDRSCPWKWFRFPSILFYCLLFSIVLFLFLFFRFLFHFFFSFSFSLSSCTACSMASRYAPLMAEEVAEIYLKGLQWLELYHPVKKPSCPHLNAHLSITFASQK